MKSRVSLLLALGLILQSFASLGSLAPAAFGAALAQGSSSLSVFSVSTVPLMILKEILRKDIALYDRFAKAAGDKNTGRGKKEKKPGAPGLSLTCLETGLKWTGRNSECDSSCLSPAVTARVLPGPGSRDYPPPWAMAVFLLACLILLARSDLPWARMKAAAVRSS